MSKQHGGKPALLFGAVSWALLVVLAFVFEALFNSGGGPEYAAPIPGALICAVLLGWIPALCVTLWKLRKE